MKKILLCLILICALLLTGCSAQSNADAERKAIIILPDGEIIKGHCDGWFRTSNNWMAVVIDGVKYHVNDWRVTIIEQ